MNMRFFLSVVVLLLVFSACADPKGEKDKSGEESKKKSEKMETAALEEEVKTGKHVSWAKNASIYEVNFRQYSKEGNIAAFQEHLPRLKAMGVDILWLMPIYPIGHKKRKGGMGSYYAVQDYKAVNPDLGTMEEFKGLVKEAHDLGMYVILDWVANHTAFDNVWAETNPGFYTRNEAGEMMMPKDTDWSDVADLNYDNPELRAAMIDAMSFWVREADVDGFRCDVAMMVPTDFWNTARAELDKIKPVFMLAEAEQKDLHEQAFDMSYTWEFMHLMNAIAKGEKPVSDIEVYLEKQKTEFGEDDYRMYFTTNHDENSWTGTVQERFGDGADAFAVLAMTIHGMPLIYSGQEAGLDRRLAFFEKDEITWGDYKLQEFFKKILELHENNPALWHGVSGGQPKVLSLSGSDKVFGFYREKDNHRVVVVVNLSAEPAEIALEAGELEGNYHKLFTGEEINISGVGPMMMDLKPWDYTVLHY